MYHFKFDHSIKFIFWYYICNSWLLYLLVYLFTYLLVYLFIYFSVYLFTYLCTCLLNIFSLIGLIKLCMYNTRGILYNCCMYYITIQCATQCKTLHYTFVSKYSTVLDSLRESPSMHLVCMYKSPSWTNFVAICPGFSIQQWLVLLEWLLKGQKVNSVKAIRSKVKEVTLPDMSHCPDGSVRNFSHSSCGLGPWALVHNGLWNWDDYKKSKGQKVN